MTRRPKSRGTSAGKTLAALMQPDLPTDVLGSYTGLAFDGSRPVQDADDL